MYVNFSNSSGGILRKKVTFFYEKFINLAKKIKVMRVHIPQKVGTPYS